MKRVVVLSLVAASAVLGLVSPTSGASALPRQGEPQTRPVSKLLSKVSAVSSNDVWAVGVRWPRGFLSEESLTERWDGRAWQTVDSAWIHRLVWAGSGS